MSGNNKFRAKKNLLKNTKVEKEELKRKKEKSEDRPTPNIFQFDGHLKRLLHDGYQSPPTPHQTKKTAHHEEARQRRVV